MTRRYGCTIIALAHATDLRYDDVVTLLTPDGYRPGRGFWLDRWLACRMHPCLGAAEPINGYMARWTPCSAVKGAPRLTAEHFAATTRTGRHILRQARHVCAVVDGTLCQAPRRPGACVYGVWTFTRNEAQP